MKGWQISLVSLALALPTMVSCRGERSSSQSAAAADATRLAHASETALAAATPVVANNDVRRSDLPLNLVGTVVRNDPAKSMAAVRVAGALVARNFRPGQNLMDDVTLVAVERSRIILRHAGALEFVAISAPGRAPTPVATASTEAIPTPGPPVTLRRPEVDRALRALGETPRGLKPGTLDVGGRRLLIVDDVEPDNLYDLLGLQQRDVLMQVNGEWINDQSNPLWTALREEPRVILVVMRAGVAQTFEYVID